MYIYTIIQNIRSAYWDVYQMPIYDFINWFFLFSLFGYLLECVVLSIEEKRLILNRGFVHGPFCIIYGFCAIIASVLLTPLVGSVVKLYIASALLATTAELVTAVVMIRVFGGFWWDYSKKPFNYKGIICLETSLGWGFIGLFFFYFLRGFMLRVVQLMPELMSKIVAVVLVVYYIIDFSICAYRRAKGLDDDVDSVGRLKVNK